MADQTQDFNAVISVENQGSSAIEEYGQSLATVAEQEQAVADGAVSLTEATTESEAAISEQTAALQEQVSVLGEQVGSLQESNAALSEQVATLQEVSAATDEATTSELSFSEAAKAAAEGNMSFMSALGPMGMAAGVAMVAVQQLQEQIQELDKAGSDAVTSEAKLEAITQQNGIAIGEYSTAMQQAVTQGQAFGLSSSQIESALARIVPIIPNMSTDLRILADAESVSAVTGGDLETTMKAIATAADTGATGPLKRLGVVIEDNTGKVLTNASETQILTSIEQKYGDVAAEVADSTAGHLAALAAAHTNFEETAGKATLASQDGLTKLATAGVNAENSLVASTGGIAGGFEATALELSKYLNVVTLVSQDALPAITGAFTGFMQTIGLMPKSTDDATASMNDLVTNADDTVSKLAQDGTDGGTQYGANTAQGIQNEQQDVINGVNMLVDAMNIKDQEGTTGTNIGAGYGGGIEYAIAQAVPGIRAQVDNIIAATDAGVVAVNNLRAAAGLAPIGGGGSAGGSWGVPDNPAPLPPTSQIPPGLQYEQGGMPDPTVTQANTDAFNKQFAANAAAAKKGGGGGGGGSKASGPTPEELENTAKQLQLEHDLATGSDTLTAATKTKTQADNDYAAATQKVNDALTANTEKEAADAQLNAAKTNASVTSQFASQSAANDAASANTLAVSIHQVTDQLTELQREADVAMTPLKDKLDADTAAMNALDAATQAQDHTFQDAENAIANSQYDLAQQTTAAMAPYQQALDASNAAYTAAQQKVQDLSNAEANDLFPIDQKLNELAQEKANLQRSNDLDDEAQKVSNYGAQLKDLIPGSEQFNAVLKEQKDAQANLNIDTQIDQETKKKDAIQNSYAVQIEAATKQEQAAQAQQKAAQAAYNDEAKLWAQKKADLDEEAQTTQHQQQLYDEQQSDKKYAQQANINADTDAVTAANNLATARAKADTDYLKELDNEQTTESFNASQHSYNWGLAVSAANDAVTKLETPYNDEATRLSNLANGIRDQKTAYDEVTQPILDDLGHIKDGEQAALDVFNKNQDSAKLATAWANAQKAGGEGLAAMHDVAPDVSGDVSAIDKAQSDASVSAAAFASAVNAPTTGLTASIASVGPAISTMATAAGTGLSAFSATWNKYLGQPSSQGWDATANLPWQVNTHNPESLYGVWAAQTHIFLGDQGLKGIFDTDLPIIKTDIVGQFDSWKTDLQAEGTADANAYADGFFNTLGDRFKGEKPPVGPGSQWETPFHKAGTEDAAAYAEGFNSTLSSSFSNPGGGGSSVRYSSGPGAPLVTSQEVHYHIATLSVPVTVNSPLPTDPNAIGAQVALAFRQAIESQAVTSGDKQYYRTNR